MPGRWLCVRFIQAAAFKFHTGAAAAITPRNGGSRLPHPLDSGFGALQYLGRDVVRQIIFAAVIAKLRRNSLDDNPTLVAVQRNGGGPWPGVSTPPKQRNSFRSPLLWLRPVDSYGDAPSAGSLRNHRMERVSSGKVQQQLARMRPFIGDRQSILPPCYRYAPLPLLSRSAAFRARASERSACRARLGIIETAHCLLQVERGQLHLSFKKSLRVLAKVRQGSELFIGGVSYSCLILVADSISASPGRQGLAGSRELRCSGKARASPWSRSAPRCRGYRVDNCCRASADRRSRPYSPWLSELSETWCWAGYLGDSQRRKTRRACHVR